MPLRFLGLEPAWYKKAQRGKTEEIFEKAHRKNLWAFSHFRRKFERRHGKVLNFTNNVIDQAYENFMKQIPGFHREPDEAEVIQKDIEKQKGRGSDDLPK